ncbi:hypothetical protein CMO83_00565 [Candidatus Woesearchaeota archaeon]|jgi:dolichyl-diphosphooligosaccharide--protein glycosyltransferase|nr:hypothetical protein [Candidatus Woesearchaeota archaeon]|tara:strand:- start:32696 stop:35944 length:3249 start_codon:yes stop_codon:yes gene_type:complete
MDPKEDDEISIDFGKIKKFFKSDEKEEKKVEVSTSDSPTNQEAKDDDVSIDFGKIKKFFKSDEKPDKTEHTPTHETAKDDGELSFDFSKIKNIFSSRSKSEADSEDELPIDWGKISNFIKKYGIVLIALIPIILSIYIRMQAGFLPVTDEWAANSVINGITSQIRSQIDQQYPNLPDANKNALVDTEFQKLLSENKKEIDDQIKATSLQFKTFFQDENGKNYMPDIDPYYWFRYANNIVDHGYPGDILRDGKSYDNHQLAPLGRPVAGDTFHAYFLAYFFIFFNFFIPGLTVMRSMFYYPVFIAALSVLLVFLIARRIAGNTGGFFAGLMMAVNSAFLGRTLFGHADSDAWVVFFPLLITWLFIETMDAKSNLKVIIFSALAGFFTGLFTFAWNGWWYIFDFLIATIGLTFLYLVFTNFGEIRRNIKFLYHNPTLRKIIIVGVIYFLSSVIFVTSFSSFDIFKNSFIGPLGFTSIKAPVLTLSLWPNVLTTVAELNEGSLNGIINSVGGRFMFFISLIGLALAISRKEGLRKFDFFYILGTALFYVILFIRFGNDRPIFYETLSIIGVLIWIMIPLLLRIIISIYEKDQSYDFKLSILLSLWIVSTIFASIKGIRFTLLLAPAFSVAFGVALGRSYTYISRLLTKELKIQKIIGSSILILLLILAFYVGPTRGAINTSRSDIPIINDAWFNSLNSIKLDSKEDAIITSWWDFGHHFKAIADRPVTFDGTTQTFPPAHWVGKLLMISDEREAIGILRMLNCGGNNAYNELFRMNNDTHKSLAIVNEIILLDKDDAEKRLKKLGINDDKIEKILSNSHCQPPESYFIASEDMIGKSGVWSHFGSWNFVRADIWKNARRMSQDKAVEYMMDKFNYTKERAENTYFEIQSITTDSEANAWVAPWPGYGGTINCNKNENGIFVCNNGMQINLSNNDVFGIDQQGTIRPRSAAFVTEDGIMIKEFDGRTLDFGMTIIPQNEDQVLVVLSSKELTGGMFTRMFYTQGHGLRYFKLFNHQRGLTGTSIYTYKVDWDGKNTTIVEDYVKKPEQQEEKITETSAAEPEDAGDDNIAISNNSKNSNNTNLNNS